MRDDREIIQIEIEFVLFPFDGLFILTIMRKQPRQQLLAMDLKHARKIMIDGEIIDDDWNQSRSLKTNEGFPLENLHCNSVDVDWQFLLLL